MIGEVLTLLTKKGIPRMVRDGGSCSWVVKLSRAQNCKYAVCARNARAKNPEGSEPHRQGFMIGKVEEVVLSPEKGYEHRYLVRFSEYAAINISDVGSSRNPVGYSTLESLGIDPSNLQWIDFKQT